MILPVSIIIDIYGKSLKETITEAYTKKNICTFERDVTKARIC